MRSGGGLSEFDAVAGKLMHEAKLTPKGRLRNKDEQWPEIGHKLEATFPLRRRLEDAQQRVLEDAQQRVVMEFDRKYPGVIRDWVDVLIQQGPDGAKVRRAAQQRLYRARDRYRESLQPNKAPTARDIAEALESLRVERAREELERKREQLERRIAAEKRFFEMYPNGEPLHRALSEIHSTGSLRDDDDENPSGP
jgi:hypothetical protein